LSCKNGPCDAISWLHKQIKEKSTPRIVMNGWLYAKFITEVMAVKNFKSYVKEILYFKMILTQNNVFSVDKTRN
jgi:hypothetical protein